MLPWVLACLLPLAPVHSQAGPILSTDSPVGFFTNAAIRLLLKSGYTVGPPTSTSNLLVTNIVSGVPVTSLQIPIWPTNFYTPSVHRLLQLAANLYDATTNRADLSTAVALPTLFRPLFYENPTHNQAGQRQVFIIGYAEVTAKDLTETGKYGSPFTGSVPPHDLSDATDTYVYQRDMVYNVPVVIGARKGLPSFDELTSDTQVQAARKLIYHRWNDATNNPINEIDPAYYLTVTNVVGLQAWNSYGANYTRPVQLYAWPDTEVLITNLQTGKQLNPPGYPSRQPTTYTYYLPPNPWPGFNAAFSGSSFVTPLGPLGSPTTNYVFLPTNSVYLYNSQQFDASGLGQPDRTVGNSNNLFHIPHFQLTVKARLRFTLVDLQTQRLLDYVNLAANQTVDITSSLVDNGCGSAYYPAYSKGGMWCTNTAGADPTPFGIRLQIDTSAGRVLNPDWTSSLPDPVYGRDADKGVARFNAQFGLGIGFPGNYPPMSPFAAPYSPFRNVHFVTLWAANDPLVHYTVGDLQDIRDLPLSVYLDDSTPPLPPTAFGLPNRRYEPWGGNPLSGSGSPTIHDLTVKDPVARQYASSDDWDFPTNQWTSTNWLGRVHRGTPWQTVYLKASAAPLSTWVPWTGSPLIVTNLGQLSTTVLPIGGMTYDAMLAHPTNDWRLASMLASLLSTNDSRQFLSPNQTSLPVWEGALDGMVVLTNNEGPDPPDGLASLVMSSNSPQAATIAAGVVTARSLQPNQSFQDPGDVLSTPELSVASPWLDTNDAALSYASLTDEAYEAIPSQLLPLLRADSIGYVFQNGGALRIEFSGSDGLAYAVQVSTDLVNWSALTTNYPVGGVFCFVDVPPPGAPRRFYRSVLMP
jgi:hypothetical protein